MKTTTRLSFLALSATLTVTTLLPGVLRAQTTAPATTAVVATTSSTDERLTQALKLPNKVEEIAQLSKAGVGDPVILTYIKNSETAYNLNAQDIIKLRDQGVSSEVTTAMIQHGAEVRQALQETAKTIQSEVVAAAPTYQTPPVVETPAQVTYVAAPVQPVSTVSVHYFGTPSYSYAPVYYPSYTYATYPNYFTFGSSYCATPRVSFGIGFGSGYRGGYHSGARYRR